VISQIVHVDVVDVAHNKTVIVLVKCSVYIEVLYDHLYLVEVGSELMDIVCIKAAYIYITITVHCDTVWCFQVVVLVGGCHVTVQVHTEPCVIVPATYI
jgi:hypothetical protein